jgi:hypothetical protein
LQIVGIGAAQIHPVMIDASIATHFGANANPLPDSNGNNDPTGN